MSSDSIYLQHMLQVIEQLEQVPVDIEWGWQTRWAVERGVAIIGQAARNVSKELQEQHSQVPWADIIGSRHKIVYDYFGVDEQTMKDIVSIYLPELKAHIEEILRRHAS